MYKDNMRQHRGEILESVIRRSGYSLKSLAEKLGISRNTIYNKFKEYDLSYDFIVRVGELIHYDFTYEYPEIKTTGGGGKNQHIAELWWLERKYTRLLEHYNQLMGFLLRMANDYHLEILKKDIDKFIELTP
jgi:transcriptional regulator with XRE-family HTH domain